MEVGPRFGKLSDPRMRAALYYATKKRKTLLSNPSSSGPTARYWRVNHPDSAFSADLLCAEIVLLDSLGQVLLPNSGSASSTFQGAVANLWDSNVATMHYWNDDSDNGTGFVKFDYGSDVTPVELRIQAFTTTPERTPTSWTLQYSSDDVNWTDLFISGGEPVFTPGEIRTYNILQEPV